MMNISSANIAIGAAALMLSIVGLYAASASSHQVQRDRIEYDLQSTSDGQLIVRETIELDAPVQRVWNAYTTSNGFSAWAVLVAKVDLRPGGSIRTSYDNDPELTGDHVNTLTIVNFVPNRVLTLQADIGPNWPEVLKKDAANLYNLILFDAIGDGRTRVTSYGLGYTDTEELRGMMQFFKVENRKLYEKLIAYVENP